MIGIDEVGRGCWAGPLLVVAARQVGTLPVGLRDSKQLSRKKRDSLFHDIKLSCQLGEGWVSSAEIDQLGLTAATRLGVGRALTALQAAGDEPIIMDGDINYCPADFTAVQTVVGADARFPLVSAASIYAKVLRDKYMSEVGPKYAVYQFPKHVGYGTALHREMLRLHGVCDLHRLSYKPIQTLLTHLN